MIRVELLEYRGVDLTAAPYVVQRIGGLHASPEIRGASRPRFGRNGNVPGLDVLGGRAITLELELVDFDEALFLAASTAVQTAFLPGGEDEYPLRIQVPGVAGGNALRVMAKPGNWALPLDELYAEMTAPLVVELVATDPLLYSDTATTVSLGVQAASGGVTFPVTFPITFVTGGGSSGVVTVVNIGNAPSPPTFRINGPVTNPTIRNETLDRALELELDIVAGDYVDIDVAARSVLLNGTANRYSSLTSPQWWELAPGANAVRYSADVSASSVLDMTYRHAWL